MRKRWWIIALVFTLALSLTSCAKPKLDTQLYPYGMGHCDGTLGYFDVYIILMQGGLYQLSIIPVSLDAPGDIISVTITNSSLGYQELISQVVINPDQEITAGPLTDADLQNYDILALTPFQAGVSFPQAQSDKDAICYIPQLGDGISAQPVQPLK